LHTKVLYSLTINQQGYRYIIINTWSGSWTAAI
jgi:hypothetical protein